MNRSEAARIVAVLAHAYPTQSVKLDPQRLEGMVDTFAMLLDDLTYEQCNAAVRVLLQTRNWMPSVAEIRATVVELEHGAATPGGEAWGDVLAAVSRWGSYRAPGSDFAFHDPLVAKCVAAMGWRNICLSENQAADRARFIELYDRLATDQRRRIQSPLLAAAEAQRQIDAPRGTTELVGSLVKKFAAPEDDFPAEFMGFSMEIRRDK